MARLSRAITNKLIHAPTAGLKKASAEGRHDLLNEARTLLGLESGEAPADDPAAEDEADLDIPPEAVETDRRTLQ